MNRWHIWLKGDPVVDIYFYSNAQNMSDAMVDLEPRLAQILDGTYLEGGIENEPPMQSLQSTPVLAPG